MLACNLKSIQSIRTSLLSVTLLLLGMMSAQADDLSKGMKIAKEGASGGVPACIGCHGGRGEGNISAGFPRLAGLNALYISEQIADFALGERRNSIMQPISRMLTPEDRVAVAEYFGSLPAPASSGSKDIASARPSENGAWLATRGRWDQELPACVQCHGPGGEGVGTTFPPLAGQPAAYIASQLHSWKSGTRLPGPMALMQVVANKLSDMDIIAVSEYYGAKAEGTAGESNGIPK
jgi:cytochrome c553